MLARVELPELGASSDWAASFSSARGRHRLGHRQRRCRPGGRRTRLPQRVPDERRKQRVLSGRALVHAREARFEAGARRRRSGWRSSRRHRLPRPGSSRGLPRRLPEALNTKLLRPERSRVLNPFKSSTNRTEALLSLPEAECPPRRSQRCVGSPGRRPSRRERPPQGTRRAVRAEAASPSRARRQPTGSQRPLRSERKRASSTAMFRRASSTPSGNAASPRIARANASHWRASWSEGGSTSVRVERPSRLEPSSRKIRVSAPWGALKGTWISRRPRVPTSCTRWAFGRRQEPEVEECVV
jgi:hypothetical protein